MCWPLVDQFTTIKLSSAALTSSGQNMIQLITFVTLRNRLIGKIIHIPRIGNKDELSGKERRKRHYSMHCYEYKMESYTSQTR